jgi:predicted anti-sigma-YlaC factor YlaD
VDDLKCEQVVEMITDYLENVLPPVEMAALREHLATCDGCSAYLEQLNRTISAMRRRKELDTVDEGTEATLVDLFHKWTDPGGAGGTR